MASIVQFQRRQDRCDRERAELAKVLSSPSFQKAPKLSRILSYICERYFDGTAGNLKQYSIAVEALQRTPGFDPHVDAIVRVDLHLLRKRLERYYGTLGKEHEIQIVLPVGQYVPRFIGRDAKGAEPTDTTGSNRSSQTITPPRILQPLSGKKDRRASNRRGGELGSAKQPSWYRRYRAALFISAICTICGFAAGLASVLTLSRNVKSAIRVVVREPRPLQAVSGALLKGVVFRGAPDTQASGIRILCGAEHDFVDSSGFRWQADRHFTGGMTFHRSNEVVRGFPDQAIFANGRMGAFRYDIPVSSGVYEVHFLFAETEPGMLEGMRETSFTIGAGETHTVDVASDAGSSDTATIKVYAGIRPASDGKIHINFWSLNGFLNALEILPERNKRPTPIRISTLPSLYVDPEGRHWLSDRYFSGGRNTNHNFSLNRVDPPLLTRERYGHFSYTIPVAEGYSYRLTLLMAERYWGAQNSGLGGPGSRIFDIRCNGMVLLNNFDLLTEEDSAGALLARFEHLQANPSGNLQIDFLPVVNYAVVNALEVEPE